MNLKFLLNPWGYARDLEADIEMIEEDFDTLVEIHQEYRLKSTETQGEFDNALDNAVLDHLICLVALSDIVATSDGVAAPNGTCRKMRRLAEEGLNLVLGKIGNIDDARKIVNQLKDNAAAREDAIKQDEAIGADLEQVA